MINKIFLLQINKKNNKKKFNTYISSLCLFFVTDNGVEVERDPTEFGEDAELLADDEYCK